jgi:hypothetical protein
MTIKHKSDYQARFAEVPEIKSDCEVTKSNQPDYSGHLAVVGAV